MARVNTIILIILFLLGCTYMNGVEKKNPDEYLRFVDEITCVFAREMEKEYGLYCSSSGGSMPWDVEKLDVSFTIQRHATIEEARRLEVHGVEKLLNLVNQHEKIRPYLREYPFKADRVGISVTFQTGSGERPLDGSVAHVYATRNKIFYSKAEIVMTQPHPHTTLNAPGGPKTEMVGGGPKVKLITLMEEPYEEALKIVEEEKDHGSR